MILNISRAKLFQQCRQKCWNRHELGLMSHREANALMTGEAFHLGIAHYFSTKSIEEAQRLAEARYRERLAPQMILPEEEALIEQNIELSKRMLRMYPEHYRNEPFQVLMPEVKFTVPLPGTEHHCWFIHKLLYPNSVTVPYDHCTGGRCWNVPHYLTGRTDAVIEWNNLIWLLEHKTATYTGQMFYNRFKLDKQTTGYIYGIWRSLGMRPHGFILNVIKKPQAKAKDPFAVTFEREPFIRTDADLLDFERDFIRVANDYENAFKTKNIYKNEDQCTSYNRECYYINLCLNHNNQEEGEFRQRNLDYVDEEYYKLLNLEVPINVSSH